MAPFALIVALTLAADPQPKPRVDLYGDPLPDGAIVRLGTERFRRVGRGAIAILPDGRTYREVHSGAGLTIREYDSADGRLLRQRVVETEAAQVVGFSRDGRVMASQQPSISLAVWDAATGKLLRSMPLDRTVSSNQLVLSPDGRFVAGISRNNRVFDLVLWTVATGEKRSVAQGTNYHSVPAFASDGSRLIAADGLTLRAWNTADAVKAWTVEGPYFPMFDCLAVGQSMIVASQNPNFGPTRINVQTGKQFESDHFPPGFPARLFWFGPDEHSLITWTRVGGSAVWDLTAGKETVRLPECGNPVAVAPDGKSFLGVYRLGHPQSGGVLQRWEIAGGKALWPDTRDRGHHETIFHLAFSRDGRRLASSSIDKTLRVWDTTTGATVAILRDVPEKIFHFAFVPDGRALVIPQQGRICLWDSATGKKLREFEQPGASDPMPPYIVWHSSRVVGDRLVAAGANMSASQPSERSRVAEWDLATGRLLFQRSCDLRAASDALAPDAEWYFDNAAKVIDTVTGRPRAELQRPPAFQIPGRSGIHHTRDGRLVAAQLYDRAAWQKPGQPSFPALRVWETATGNVLAHFDSRDTGEFTLSPDGRWLAVADPAGFTVWDVASGKSVFQRSIHRPMQDNFAPNCASVLAFSPDGRTLATGHPDSTILLWELPARFPQAAPRDEAEWDRLWADLASPDPKTGYAAAWRLADAPKPAVLFLKRKLKPADGPGAKRLAAIVIDLDSDSFAKRQAASKELAALGDSAELVLRDALKTEPSAEARKRIEEILTRPVAPPSADALRLGRAVHALESIGSPDARALLTELAKGDPDARLTRDVREALARMSR